MITTPRQRRSNADAIDALESLLQGGNSVDAGGEPLGLVDAIVEATIQLERIANAIDRFTTPPTSRKASRNDS
jgi:hypothetical protein